MSDHSDSNDKTAQPRSFVHGLRWVAKHWKAVVTGAAATFAFTFTVFVPAFRNYILPAFRARSGIDVDVYEINDRALVHLNDDPDNQIVGDEVPFVLYVTNSGSRTATVIEVILKLVPVSGHPSLASAAAILREWDVGVISPPATRNMMP